MAQKGAQKKGMFKGKCFRCGTVGHRSFECTVSRSKDDRKCGFCDRTGHVTSNCFDRKKAEKEKAEREKNKSNKGGNNRFKKGGKHFDGINQLRVNLEDDTECFYVDSKKVMSEDGYIDVHTFPVGNLRNLDQYRVQIDNVTIPVLIDSGSTLNLIDEKTYKKLVASNELEHSSTRIFAYQSTSPLKVVGQFKAKVDYGDSNSVIALFHVIAGEGPSILSRKTSEELNLLRVGPPKTAPVVVHTLTPGSNSVCPVVDKYPGLFKGVGCYKDFKLKLHIDKSIVPVQQPFRRIPFNTREKVSREVKRLLSHDILERVNGPTTWVNPVVPVSKKTGDVRLCLDMRRANEAIVRERHVIPKIEEVVTELHGARYFSKLDLREAYHQVLLDEDSRDITTFACHDGLFRYKRLVYGCKTAFESFQKIIEGIIVGCKGARNISDDILLWGSTLEELNDRTDIVFRKLLESGLKLNLSKCVFGVTEIVYAGHLISNNGVSLVQNKVAAIVNISKPKSVSEVKSFLGMVSYCNKFIKDYSTISEPIRRLTRKNQVFVWGKEQDESFNKLKDALVNADTLAYYNPNADTRIIVDASPYGLGGILVQQQEDGNYKPVYYGSRALTDVETRYSQTEREALGVVWSCEYFHFYIFDSSVTIQTDHKPLLSLLSSKSKPPPRIERWLMRLQAYTYSLEYVPGCKNSADYLSRNPQPVHNVTPVEEYFVNMIVDDAIPKSFSREEIVRASKEDKEIVDVLKAVKSGIWSKEMKKLVFYKIRDQLSFKDGILLKQRCIVIPKKLRSDVLDVAHKSHQGIIKTMSLLREKVWWPKIRDDLERRIKDCHPCQVNTPTVSKCEPLEMTPCPPAPFHLVATDIKGPLFTNEYLLTIIDYYSRFPFVYILKSTESRNVINCFESTFNLFGFPGELVSDNGSQFISDETEGYLKQNNIKHRRVSPYWPSANGEIERFNRTLKKAIDCFAVEGKPWKKWLSAFMFDYRCSVHRATGKSPAEILFKYKVKNSIPDFEESLHDADDDQEVRAKDTDYKKSLKEYTDKKRNAKYVDVKVGDEVLIKNNKKMKSSTYYIDKIFRVIKVYARSIKVVDGDGKILIRNKAHVKVYNRSENRKPIEKVDLDDNDSPCDEIGNDHTYVPCFDIEPDPIPRPINIRQERVSANRNRLDGGTLRRDIRAPIRYGEHIMFSNSSKR